MTLRIIGVGWGRTGTLSLKTALEILRFGPCYHMTELLKNPEHVSQWQRALNGDSVDWDSIFKGYESAVDYPTCQYWDLLGRHFKDAKYILTIRDADTWYESVKSTIYSTKPNLLSRLIMMTMLPFSRHKRLLLDVFKYIEKSIWEIDFEGRFEDKKYAIQKFNDHINEILSTIKSEKLLVYDIKSGWNPLCKFLSVDVPTDVPFPNLNKREQFKKYIGGFL